MAKIKNKLELRKFNKKDINRIMKIFPDKEITDSLGLTLSANPPKITKEFETKWLNETLSHYKIKNPDKYNLAITLNKELIGSIGINKIDRNNSYVEIGYWIGKEYWGKGNATKALKLFLKYIDKRYKSKRIGSKVFTFNPSSKRVLEKCGFKLEGIMRKSKRGKDNFYDEYILSRIK